MTRVTVHLTAPARRLPPVAIAIVVDVLRATTTLSAALAAGAARVTPAATVEEAFALRAKRPDALLCGERGGRIVPGFDLGNSPLEYTAARVAGRELLFASTNGSRALVAAGAARRRLIAAFTNAGATLVAALRAAALVRSVGGDPEVAIVCAGKEGGRSLEDAGLAGWLCAGLAAHGGRLANDAARAALAIAPRDPAAVRTLVEGAPHARDLRAIGPAYAADVAFCATLDSLDRAFEV